MSRGSVLEGVGRRLRRLDGWLRGGGRVRRFALAALLGAMATAALPPLHILPLYLVAFTGLARLIDASPGRRAAFAVGWWFGFGHFVSGLYWFANALMTDPERFAWLIAPAVFGISGLLAVYPAIAAMLARACAAGGPRIAGLALAWVATEWLRGWLFTGFPWNLIGLGWTVSDAMIQLAALTGVWGLSLVTVFAAAAPAALAGPGGWRARAWPSVLGAALLAAVWAGGAIRLANAGDETVANVRLRIVQPNVAQDHKWKPELRAALFRRHLALTRSPGFKSVTHVIWPETAVAYALADEPRLRAAIAAVTPPGGAVITGAIRTTPQGAPKPQIWNNLAAVDGRGRVVASYDKFHLVPFGEYVPFRSILPLDKITYGSLDFSAGPGPRTLRVPGLPPFSPLICYEAIFPGRVLDPNDRPKWLLNITNDAWFGESSGPYQHFAAARMRAVEEGLPLVRAANTGISAVVDPYGRVRARLGLGEGGVLDSPLPTALEGAPPFARWGKGALLAFVVAAGGLVGWWSARSRILGAKPV